MTVDPGPKGDFEWCGLNWVKRSWGGAPTFNGQYDPANVVPNADGTVTLRVTNPTAAAPWAAELNTTRRGFGYGTYTCVVDANLTTMRPEVVFGGLFTYDNATLPAHNEIDVHETSAWGGGPSHDWPVKVDHTYYHAVDGENVGINVSSVAAPGSRVQTHVMTWKPDKITWDSYIGEGISGTLIKHSEATLDVPAPAAECLVVNLWVFTGNSGSPETVPEYEVTLRSVSFAPLAPEPESQPVDPKVGDISPTTGYEWLDEDGIMGKATTRNIQRLVGATDDGIWGRMTTEAIQRWFNGHWDDPA